jgi:branched-chain amino acid transport system substrate-binding protein
VKGHFFSFLVMLAVLIAGFGTTDVTMAASGTGTGGLTGEIAIGAVWSLTGDAAAYGPQQKKAADLAVDEINKSGILGAAKIRLITEDDRSTKEGAIAAFDKLLKKDKVIAILGPTLSNSAKAADPIAQDSKVVVLAVSNTVSGVVEIGDFIFRDSLPESVVQPNTVKVTQDKLGYKKVAVMYGDDDAFTKGGYDVFKQALEAKGIQILTTETFKKKDTDFSAQLTKIKSLNPDAIIVSALAEEAAGIMSQGRQLGIPASVHFIGGNGFNSPKLPQLGGQFAEGAISGAAWFISNDTPGNKDFVAAYKGRYDGVNPDQFAAQAYAGVRILAHAIAKAGSGDSKAVRDVMAQIKDLDTVLGKYSFDQGRNPVHEPIVQIIKNGKFELFQ